MTTVVNILTDEYDVYIGRSNSHLGLEASVFQNIYRLEDYNNNRITVLELFRIAFLKRVWMDGDFKRKVEKLRGKRLGCYCKPKKCHGDLIVEYLRTGDIKSLKKPKLSKFF